MKKLLLFSFIFTFGLCNAQLIFQDDLNAYTTGVQLSGQGLWTNDSSVAGLGSCVGAGCANAGVTATPLNYLNWGTTAKSLELKPNSDGVGRAFPAVTTGDIYVGFVINVTGSTSPYIDFFRVMSGSSFNTSFRLAMVPASTGVGPGFILQIKKGDTGNSYLNSMNAYTNNQNHLIILKYSQLPGTNDDILKLYVDPIYANGELLATPSAIMNMPNSIGGDQAGSIDRLGFRQNAGPTGLPTGQVGLISVAKTWADLTFLPLAISNFNTTTFSVIATSLKQGSLAIKSNLDFKNATLSIYDIQGRKIHNSNVDINAGSNDFNVTPILNSGIYIVEITTDNNQKFTQKIAIN